MICNFVTREAVLIALLSELSSVLGQKQNFAAINLEMIARWKQL
jgi:hypothetical protein